MSGHAQQQERPGRRARYWMSVRCLNARHEACRDRRRCDCHCHALVTGGLRLHMEPA